MVGRCIWDYNHAEVVDVMIPILYNENEVGFTTQGVGALTDALTCYVEEARNGEYELEMTYPVNGIHFSEIAERMFICAIPSPYREKQPFRIYKITKPLDGIVTIYARHISYDLSGIPVMPFKASGVNTALNGIKTNAVQSSLFYFWTDITSGAEFSLESPAAARSCLGGVRGSILDTYGGEFEWDFYDVKLHDKRGKDNGVTVRYGKNMTALDCEIDAENTITGIMPYWQKEGVLVTSDPKVIYAEGATYQKSIPVDFTMDFEEQPTPAQLKARGESYVNENDIGEVSVSMDVSFAQLEQMSGYEGLKVLEACDLCDTVTVQHEKLGVNIKAEVVKTKTDVLTEKYESVGVGSVRANIAQTIADQNKTINEVIRPDGTVVAEKVAGFINGLMASLGAQYDAATKSDVMSILFENLDENNPLYGALGIGTQGIMISKTRTSDGEKWDWTTAINANGIMAGIIVAGILADKTGTNWWNLDTGEFHAGGNATFAGNLQAAGGTFSGNLQAAGGTFSGNLTAQVGGQIGGWKIGQNYIYSDIDVGDYTYRVFIQTYMQKHGTDSWIYSVQRRPVDDTGEFTGMFYIRGDGKIMLSSLSYPQIFGNGGVLQLAATDDGAEGVVIEPGNTLRPAGSNDQGSLGTQNHRWKYGYFDRIFGSVASFGNGFTAYTDMALSLVGGSGTVENDFNVFGTFYAASGGIASASDRGKKQDIAELDREKSAEFIYSLIPTEFRYKNGSSGRLHHGFIAQDVKKSMGEDDWGLYCQIHEPEIKTEDDKIIKEAEDTLALRYEELIADIVATLQSIDGRLKKLEGGSR